MRATLLAALLLMAASYAACAPVTTLPEGSIGPDIKLKSITGETVKLSRLARRNIVVLMFWFHG